MDMVEDVRGSLGVQLILCEGEHNGKRAGTREGGRERDYQFPKGQGEIVVYSQRGSKHHV